MNTLNDNKRLGWIVVPAYREEFRIETFLLDLMGTLKPLLNKYQFNITVVNDGSSDGTAEKVVRVSKQQPLGFLVECVSLLRNFGHQSAVICGLVRAARGGADFVITMDADGEHPPSTIPKMIELWENGEPIVHTIRLHSRELGFFKRFSSDLFYFFINIGAVKIKPGMADFKVWDGELLRQIHAHLPSCGSTRLFAAWLSPDGACVEFGQPHIPGRTSRFTLRKMISFAFRGFFSYSDLPLRLSTLIGALSILIGVIYFAFAVFSFFCGKTTQGWTSLTLLVTFFGGIQVFCIGILGEYLIQRNFRSLLPNFVIRPNRNNHLNVE